jgi:predicted secreted protein
MSVISAIAIYFIIWWVVLFAVLPWGVQTQQDEGDVIPGTAPSAPVQPHMFRKVIATTIIATIVFTLFYLARSNGWLTMDAMPFFPKFD